MVRAVWPVPGGTLASQQAGGDGRVPFANVPPGTGQTALTIDPGIGVSCEVRAMLPLAGGTVTHTLAVCQ